MTDLLTSPITGWIGGFLLGVLTGAAAQYYGDKFTDQRKRQEARSSLRNEFERCRNQMPELFDEMKADLASNPLKSEFVLLDVHLVYGGFPENPLSYYMDGDRGAETYRHEKEKVMVHAHLLDKVKILESAGFVRDITRKSVPYFRMSDQFKEMLQG